MLRPVYFQGLGQPQTEWDVLLSPKHWLLLLSLKITELSSCWMDIFSFSFVSLGFLTKHQGDKWLQNLMECSREISHPEKFFKKRNLPLCSHQSPHRPSCLLNIIFRYLPIRQRQPEIYFPWEIFWDYFGHRGYKNPSLQQYFDHLVCAHNILNIQWRSKMKPLPTVSFYLIKKLLQTHETIKR